MGVLLTAVTAMGLDIVGIDGGFLKHPLMKDYVYLVLVAVTCDGQNMPIGVAIVPGESHGWVSWFIDCMCEMGWGPLLDTKKYAATNISTNGNLVVIMDRGKGLIKGVSQLENTKIRHCFKHIERNITHAIGPSQWKVYQKLIWEIQVMFAFHIIWFDRNITFCN